MKIDVAHALYTGGMIILAFVAALVVTKTLSKYLNASNGKENTEEGEDS
jgi:hypothetical protein